MKKEEFGVITFKSTHHAIQGESILKKEDVKFRTIPTPREVSTSCGLAVKFDLEIYNQIIDIIEEKKMNIDSVYKIIKEEKESYSEKLYD